MKRALIGAGLLTAALAGGRVTQGCGPDAGDGGIDARADALTKPDATPDAVMFDVVSDAPPTPCSVPGYILDDAYDVSCGFCYASSTAVLPPPIAWEPCDPAAFPSGMVCRQMVEDWAVGQGPFAGSYISQVAPIWIRPDGTVTLGISRFDGMLAYRMVADADGPVYQAIVETSNSCTLGSYDLRDGRVVYRIFDSESGTLSEYGGGAYVASVGDLRPRVFVHYHNDTQHDRDYYVSSMGVFDADNIGSIVTQYDWATTAPVRVIDSSALNGGFGIAHVWPRSDAVFLDAYSGRLQQAACLDRRWRSRRPHCIPERSDARREQPRHRWCGHGVGVQLRPRRWWHHLPQ